MDHDNSVKPEYLFSKAFIHSYTFDPRVRGATMLDFLWKWAVHDLWVSSAMLCLFEFNIVADTNTISITLGLRTAFVNLFYVLFQNQQYIKLFKLVHYQTKIVILNVIALK